MTSAPRSGATQQERVKRNMFAEIGNGDVLLWMFEFFMFVIWFWILITIFGDIFRDHEMSGGMKALWTIFVIVLPFLGILIYLIVRGPSMGSRAIAEAKANHDAYDAYVASTVGSGDPATQISKAKELLDAGAIDQSEFEALKKKALG
jgi:hypothetical protein